MSVLALGKAILIPRRETQGKRRQILTANIQLKLVSISCASLKMWPLG
jgi:hypothetical protein